MNAAIKPPKPDTAGQLETVAQALAHGTYVNPFAHVPGLIAGRIDQGRDWATTKPSWGKPIGAIGAGEITAIDPNFYNGEPAIYETLTSGPLAGHEVYYSEQLTPAVTVGQTVKAGQQIATVASSGTGLELGWAKENLPAAHGHYHEGEPTPEGKNFAGFLDSTKHHGEEGILEALGHYAEGPFGPGTELEHEINKINPANAAAEAAAKAATAAVEQGFKWVEEAFGAQLVKGLLYAIFAGGGVALIIAGLGRATGTHPYRAARSVAGNAAVAGALA